MTKLEQLLNRANKAEIRLDNCCGAIAKEIQKKIPWQEVTCNFQPSDGFVIMVDLGNYAPENIPVQCFIDTWADHKEYTPEDLEYLQ